MGIVKKIVIGVPVTLVAGVVGLIVWAALDPYKEECGKGMHNTIMRLHDNGAAKTQNLRMLDIWDDRAVDADPDDFKPGGIASWC